MSGSSRNSTNKPWLSTVGELKQIDNIPWVRSGINPNIGATPTDFWAVGGAQVFPSAPGTISLVSTSALDTAAGTGAQTIRVYGLDVTYTRITEDVPLNGTTPVVSTASFLRVTRIESVAVGSTGFNQGTITGTIGGNPQISMTPIENFSHNINYTVPAKYWLIVTSFIIMAQTDRDIIVRTYVRNPFVNNGIWKDQTSYIVPTVVGQEPRGLFFFPPATDLRVEATKLQGAAGYGSVLGIGYLTSDPGVNVADIDITELY